MNKRKLLALAVATAIAGTTMLGATSATSDYMHYQDGTISICDPSSNGTKCITMKDKNEGATQAGIGCIKYQNYCAPMWEHDYYDDVESCIDDNGTTVYCNLSWESFGDLFSSQVDCEENGEDLFNSCLENHGGEYGNHYQRGNNHEFAIGCYEHGCSDTVTSGAVTNKATWDNSYNNYGYTGVITNFMKGSSDYWQNNSHYDGLRGGADDSQANNRGYDEEHNVAFNYTGRQGPCGEGYHVPSIGEWNQVLKYWAQENGIELEDDGGLKYNYDTLDGLKFQEDFKIPFAGYRLFSNAKVYYMGNYADLSSSSPNVGNDVARFFNLGPDGAYNNPSYRADGLSVRCFKDSYLSFPSSEGGEPQVIVNIGQFNGGQNTCTGSNFIFENITAGTNTGTYTRSGVFECSFGNGRSSSIIQLQLSGNLVASGDRVLSGTNVKMINSEWTSQPLGLKFASTLLETYEALTTTQVLFRKSADLIGVASGVVTIKLTVPGGTPDGTYNGTLVLTY